MAIDFGSILKYYDRGFGFVGRTFFNLNEKVFFHITKIRKKHPELAQILDNRQAFETVNFWYEAETNEEGKPRVKKLWLNAENIPPSYTSQLCDLTQKVESIWKNLDSPKPNWLDLVTIELVGVDRRYELSLERDNLKSQLQAAEEERRREEAEALQKNEIRRIAQKYELIKPEADELHQLLTQMRPLEFKRSKQLSAYIVKHRLGYKYQHISGILRMREAGLEWDFNGGFPKKIYAILCKELKLHNQGTRATAVKFTPYKNLY